MAQSGPKARDWSADDPDDSDDGEIEILEIVGLDDEPPASPQSRPGPGGEAEEAGEILLDLDAEAVDAGPPGSAAPAPPEVAALSDRERLIRLQADFENFKKRAERERDANERHAAAALVTRLLPVLDNFETRLVVAIEQFVGDTA